MKAIKQLSVSEHLIQNKINSHCTVRQIFLQHFQPCLFMLLFSELARM